VNRILGALFIALPFLGLYVAFGITSHDWAGVTLAFAIALVLAVLTFACISVGFTLWDRRS
jgi:hypothetical protein